MLCKAPVSIPKLSGIVPFDVIRGKEYVFACTVAPAPAQIPPQPFAQQHEVTYAFSTEH